MASLVAQNQFIYNLKNSVNSLYGEDSIVTVICTEIKAEENSKFSVSEALGVLSAAISRAIVKENDSYSFFDGKFYILTHIESRKVIDGFIKSLAVKLASIYGGSLFLEAGFAQHPYDVMNIEDLPAAIKSTMERVSVARYDVDSGMVTEDDPNYIMGVELTSYLKKMQDYAPTLYRHSLAVSMVSFLLAKALKISNQAIKKILVASILHDVGYLMIDKSVFLGSKQVKAQNSKVIKLHPVLATRKLLEEKHIFRNVFDFIEQHHEHLDGAGYPFGLSRRDIFFESQIIAIADTYSLLVERQPGLSFDAIAGYFEARSGILWEEEIVDTFVSMISSPLGRKIFSETKCDSLKDLLELYAKV